MTTSELAFGKFQSTLKYGKYLANNDYITLARIVYILPRKHLEETLPVTFRLGIEYGKLDIYGGRTINAETANLELNAKLQLFKINCYRLLEIIGTSTVFGSYKVLMAEA
jgi:hypothetical protein